jgi:hypothetical protein
MSDPTIAALTKEVRDFGLRAEVPLARYDPDALIGHVMRWLAENDAVLTAAGPIAFDDFIAQYVSGSTDRGEGNDE